MMKINRCGITRIVFEFKAVVIKIPNFSYSWEHFIVGVLANIREHKTYRYNSGKYDNGLSHLLCPVLWCSWGGWFLIMKRVAVMTDDEYLNTDTSIHQLHFGGDDKSDSYGYLNGYVVKIDYGQRE